MSRSRIPLLVASLLIGAMIGAGVWNQIANPYFISGDTERPWAIARYEKALAEVGMPFPSLDEVADTARPQVVQAPGKLTTSIHADDSKIEDTGDLLRPTTGESHVELPDGTRVSVLAVALHIPSHQDENKSVTWRDPKTMMALTSAEIESLGIQSKPNFNRNEQRLLMVTDASQPVLWHGVTLFNPKSLTKLNSGHSAYLTVNPAVWSVDLGRSHALPIEILLPISNGESETKTWDFQKDPVLQFSNPHVRLVNLFATDGEISGHSAGREHATFDWKAVRSADFYRQSFALLCSEPSIRLKSFRLEDASGNGVFGNGPQAVKEYAMSKPLDQVGPLSVTVFPETARVLFKLPPFPEMTEYENLFDIPLPKKTIRSRYELEGQLSSTLSLYLGSLTSEKVSEDEFPFDIGPDQTHTDLLKRYQRMLGRPLVVDAESHRVEFRESRWLARVKAWIDSL